MTSYLHAADAAALATLPHARPAVEHVLAVRGRGGYRQYRIPALTVTTAGTVLAAYDGRPNLDDLPNTIDLLLRRSTDSGHTWEEQRVVRTGTGLDGYGDPSLLVDTVTGRIFMFHAAGTHAGFFEAVPGLEPEDDVQHCDLSFSDNDGVTWQHRRLTGQLKQGPETGITGIFAAAGQGIQIHAGPFTGRLVQQFVVLVDGEIKAASAFSDDHGESWRLGSLIGKGPDGVGPNENKVVCLQDGRLLLHSRATPRRLAAISADGGGTWSPLERVEDLPDPSDNGSLTRFDGLPNVTSFTSSATDAWLLASNNHDTSLRRNTVLSLSADNGATWPAKLVLCEGSSAYSTATRLPDGNIGVLYERQAYREIVFASVPTEQLTEQLRLPRGTAASAAVSSDALEFHMELRSITPGRPSEWRNAGEFHVLSPDNDGEWDVQTWKEVGQGYSVEQVQVLGTREAQDLNYGPIIPGYKAGDILAFTGRARNVGTRPIAAVVLLGPHANADSFPPTDLAPGAEALYFTPVYTLTEEDLGRDALELAFVVEYDGGSRTAERRFRFDLRTGAVDTTA
ncbi:MULTISPECIES: exo-alpha-sialidase [Arthrobacter]|uniref:exo-alpha-sialidase n=1 Tax=Arthrobacter terricola TaxID=2547396 RepID=A0A4R5KSI2_9MICC|nr:MULTISPECIES: sialidase family protein [Arthrobacter]MBT8160653.1 glycoside hydrolase [Arthrobacter sp. GN70]TDF97810.1 exo-alpha-sialidase [Arthrobacter terricola]